jgi:hypothetical protein
VSNKFTYPITSLTGKTITLPIELKWDLYGRSDSIDLYEDTVKEEIIGKPVDFEVSRYAHKPYGQMGLTEINYKFYFYSGNTTAVPTSTPNNWVNSYLAEGFNSEEVYYYSKPFTKSFFKLDFYDSKRTANQTNYFTIILPVQQGLTESKSISPLIPNVEIKKPDMKLDYVGDKEGFFIYWLRDPSFLNINTFYMSAKFFDGRLGVFVRMMTEPQCNLPNVYRFNESNFFYRKVVLDFNERTYQQFNKLDVRIGTGTPIEWYEYVNPPA